RHGRAREQRLAVAFEDVVLFHRHEDVEVALRAVLHARLAFAAEADALAVFNARRNGDRQRAFLADRATPAALAARRLDDISRTLAAAACPLHGEEALAHAHAAMAAALRAGFRMRARLRARAMARLALLGGGNVDLGLLAVER